MTKVKSHAATKASTGISAKGNVQGAVDGSIPSQVRAQMIADAAYRRAEKRNFSGGDPADDWLVAEAEIDSLLQVPYDSF